MSQALSPSLGLSWQIEGVALFHLLSARFSAHTLPWWLFSNPRIFFVSFLFDCYFSFFCSQSAEHLSTQSNV
jgi:hypothetical protein